MDFHLLSVFLVLFTGEVSTSKIQAPSYDRNYKISYGQNNIKSFNQGRELQLSLDKSSGSGIQSKSFYSSGFYHMRIKLPGNDSAGVITTFYITSHTNNHDELDFEFLGNTKGKPYIIQTNVYAKGEGNREQRIHLWFDPTTDFHDYSILWNSHQIVFFIDKVPIRVFKNNANIGVGYPTQPMQIEATIWNGDWATDNGRTKINWSHAPFQAHFQGFSIDGCPENSSTKSCNSSNLWWNNKKYWRLTPSQEKSYHNIISKYTIYNYCDDKKRYRATPLECH